MPRRICALSFRRPYFQRPWSGECLSFHHHRVVVLARGRRAPQQQDEGNGRERKNHHQLEIVDVANDGSLRLYGLIERRPSACGQGAEGVPHDVVIKYVIECRDMAWTAYAVLSREPSSFWPPSLSRKSPAPRRLTRLPPPQELDRSDDGRDHTVLPYARFVGATAADGVVHDAVDMLARRT